MGFFSPARFTFSLSSVRYPLSTAAYPRFLYYLWISVSWEPLWGGRGRINSLTFEVHLSHSRLQRMTHSGWSSRLTSGSRERFLLPELSWECGRKHYAPGPPYNMHPALRPWFFPLWGLKTGSQGCSSSSERCLWQVEIWKLSQGHLDPSSLPGCHFWTITRLYYFDHHPKYAVLSIYLDVIWRFQDKKHVFSR